MTDDGAAAGPDYSAIATGLPGFVERFGLWSEQQSETARRVASEVTAAGLEAIRVGFADPHGLVRSKTLTPKVFAAALRNGMDFGLGPFMFDTGHNLVIDPFRPGGGIGITELEGASDFIAVPDPVTFRVLPWADKTGWVLCDEYFKTGQPVPLSPRAALKKQLKRAADRGYAYMVGLEVEWYLTRLVDEPLEFEQVGTFGSPGAAPKVRPVDAGYQFNSESWGDAQRAIRRGSAAGDQGRGPAAAHHRARKRAWPARVHLRPAARAGRRRRDGAVPLADQADRRTPRVSRKLHVQARPRRLRRERLAPAPVAVRRRRGNQPVHLRRSRRDRLSAGPCIRWRYYPSRRGGVPFYHPDGERIPKIRIGAQSRAERGRMVVR